MEKRIQHNIVVEQKPGLKIIFLQGGNYYYYIEKRVIMQGVFKTLDFLLKDANLEEIMYDGPKQPVRVFHRKYGMCDTSFKLNEQMASSLIKWIAENNKKIINQNNPILDGTLYEGSRVNITIPPASPRYSTITIRKFRVPIITVLDLLKWGTISEDIAAFIWAAVDGLGSKSLNMLIVGGTGSGKTTFLNAITMFIPIRSRIVTIEDTAELRMKHANVLTMISKKEQGINMDMLLKNALRQRPDRIIVGEVRGSEASTLFGAMNTGNDGCMGTLHANNARECVDRVTNPPMNVPPMMLNALDLVVVLKKIASGGREQRVVCEVTEVSASGGEVRFNQLYTFDAKKNKLVSTGVPSALREDISKAAGISAKDFDFLLKDREKILKRIMELSYTQNLSIDRLLDLIEKNRFHWRDELAKKKLEEKKRFSKIRSWFRKDTKKEEVMYY
jgi:flagellar protein FlaI